MFQGLPPAQRRLRALRHQLRRRRRWIAAALVAVATVSALRAVAPSPPDTVDVLVAARDLPSGTLLDRSDVLAQRFPADLAPSVTSPSPVGRVLAAPLARGEVLTEARVVGPGLAEAQAGQTVLPVRLPDAGMATLLRPGDEVDLMATDPGSGATRVVAREVTVLAAPAEVPEGPASGTGGALVVVGTSAVDAVEITSAALSQFLTVSWNR
ncbi:SAF domain-containing protein [Microbacterium sp. ARD31]|uniref:SAF domain-containing protein n=1 Tax=Microbacterium sp. ARD31 TaxID=2962576 RepID=UPI002882042A|nr:SAF domain-containing protein [Microbacterium sp. ARD31]MDT0183453.1 SAF domain-containing protein [Microbacterium sp. ARD31]